MRRSAGQVGRPRALGPGRRRRGLGRPSSEAEDYVQRLRGDQTPIVIVYRRAGGLTAARGRIAADQLLLNASELPRTSRF
jgi:hypothetical protein